MKDEQLDDWLHQLREESVELSPKLIQQTHTRMKRRGVLSILLTIVIWSCIVQLMIGAVLIAVIPGLQQEWIWRLLLWTEASFLMIQLLMIWGLRNREGLPSYGELRSILRGGNIVD